MFFLFQRYVENVKQDTNIGTNILRVSASDEDADNNGAIRYSLTAPGDPSDLDYFDIQPESGWIYLTRPLDVSFHFWCFSIIFLRSLGRARTCGDEKIISTFFHTIT